MADFSEIMSRPRRLPYKGTNGRMDLASDWFGLLPETDVSGGPFARRPQGQFGVCLLERKIPGADIHFPIEDFRVPKAGPELDKMLHTVAMEMVQGRQVYVGCAGGYGRTGTILALLAKLFGAPDPVKYVRSRYHDHAVETKAQEQFVENYDVTGLRKQLFRSVLRWRLTSLAGRIYGPVLKLARR